MQANNGVRVNGITEVATVVYFVELRYKLREVLRVPILKDDVTEYAPITERVNVVVIWVAFVLKQPFVVLC